MLLYIAPFITYCHHPVPQQSLRGKKLWWEGSFEKFQGFDPFLRQLNLTKNDILE